MVTKRLVRKNKMLFGVCGGLGDYFNLDPVFFRLGFIVFTIFFGFGIFLYVAMILLVPEQTSLHE